MASRLQPSLKLCVTPLTERAVWVGEAAPSACRAYQFIQEVNGFMGRGEFRGWVSGGDCARGRAGGTGVPWGEDAHVQCQRPGTAAFLEGR